MNVSRRSFLGYCIGSAAALGLSQFDLFKLKSALASTTSFKVVWLSAAGCSGCSISLLNRISQTAPGLTVASLLTDDIDLIYHPTLMAAAGETAVEAAYSVASDPFILVVEGGIPTAFGGAAGWAWTHNDTEVTLQSAVMPFANSASQIVAVGTCASFGGVSASGPNPGGVQSVSAATGNPNVINVPGCPAHPDWIVWTLAQLIARNTPTLDGHGRPTEIYGNEVHANCPRLNAAHAQTFGQDNLCLLKLGCAGPGTKSPCPTMKWNNGVNWCVDANSPCLARVEPGFPDFGDFYSV